MRQFAVFDIPDLWYVRVLNSYGNVYSDARAIRKKEVETVFNGGYILAPTTQQWMQYKAYLSVYGKEVIHVSENMKSLIEGSHVCHHFSVGHFIPVKQSIRLL